jgi:hypothetical protein
MSDRGDWMLTSSGRVFYPFDPRPEEIHIEDIAAGLSRQCRYAGQLCGDVDFYSTAEHSVALARHFRARREPGLAKWALLHDAAEAYLYDLLTPLKRAMPEYRACEARLLRAICIRFGLPPEEPPEVKAADMRIVADERPVIMAPSPVPWTPREPLGATIVCYSPRFARAAFLHHFRELFGACA